MIKRNFRICSAKKMFYKRNSYYLNMLKEDFIDKHKRSNDYKYRRNGVVLFLYMYIYIIMNIQFGAVYIYFN
jgi:hypothetical protein